MPVDWAKLRAPIPKPAIQKRKGPGGKYLDYITARFVVERLNEACGPDGWQRKIRHLYTGNDGQLTWVCCEIGLRVQVPVLVHSAEGNGSGYTKHVEEWVWRDGIGVASNIEPSKGADSDAFKRAAVAWGIGLELYKEPWFDELSKGRGEDSPGAPGGDDSGEGFESAPPSPRPARLSRDEQQDLVGPSEPSYPPAREPAFLRDPYGGRGQKRIHGKPAKDMTWAELLETEEGREFVVWTRDRASVSPTKASHAQNAMLWYDRDAINAGDHPEWEGPFEGDDLPVSDDGSRPPPDA